MYFRQFIAVPVKFHFYHIRVFNKTTTIIWMIRKPFTNNKNNIRSQWKPCGPPQVTAISLEIKWLIQTHCTRFWRKLASHLITVLLIPSAFHLATNDEWLMREMNVDANCDHRAICTETMLFLRYYTSTLPC